MNPFRQLLVKLRAGNTSHRAASDEIRLQVINVTRRTQLVTSLEVAGNGAMRSKGLLGRKGLARGEGMWIIPCEAVHTFGMQFVIDLVYLDRKHRIRKVKRNVPPWRISACFSAHSVLELPAGTVLETQSQPGDQIDISPVPIETAGIVWES